MITFQCGDKMQRLSGVLSASLLSLTCITFPAQASEVVVERLVSPAPPNSSLSRLVGDEQGHVYLSWVSQEDDMAILMFSRFIEGNWTVPEIIASGSDWFINWADFPALSVNQGNLAAHWLQVSAPGTYDYDIKARFYDSEIASWSAERTVHSDGVNAEHGFVSMLPLSSERTFMSWLDGRQTKNESGNSAMTLRAGIFSKSGEAVSEWELDGRVCDCCQTSSALTSKGPIVVYRDRSEGEIRDIYATRYTDGQWTDPQAVYKDDWQIAGCPVNGPAVAAKDDFVAVAWFSAKGDMPSVRLALSTNSADSFSDPITVAGSDTIGRVDTVILGSGITAVSWIDTADTDAKIMLNLYGTDGQLLSRNEVAKTSASRRSGFPIIEAVGESVFITWTDITLEPVVKVARISF